MQTPSILIVIPTYNERDNICLLIQEIKRVLPGAEILVAGSAIFGAPDPAEAVRALRLAGETALRPSPGRPA